MTAQERDEGSLLAPGDLVSGEYVVDAVARRGPGWIGYRGHHVERTDELVMITSLRADAPSAGYIEAFARRSQWLAEARIPNVPPLLASGVEMGLPFIVTPWVDGTTLRELLDAEGSLSREEALRIIKAIGESLDALHARRPVVVHQLLSLDNIRIDAMTRAARLMDAGVAHALRLARVDDVHAAAKIDGVFRAPEDNVGRTPSPAIDRYALAKLAEVLLSPIPPGSTLARVISRGSSDLSASRFSTCASFVQSLALALKEARPADAPHVAPPLPAPPPPSGAATHSPTASAVGAATKSPSGSAIGAATKSPSASAIGAATRSPAVPSLAAATKASDPALRAVAIPPLGKRSDPAMTAVPAPTKSSDPAIPAVNAAPAPTHDHGSAPSATHSPTAGALGAAHKPPTPPLPTAPRPAAPPPLRTPKSTLMGMAPPAPPKKPMASTLMGIAPPSVDAPSPSAPATIAAAPAPAEIAAPVGVAPKSASEEERFPFAPEPTKTERVEIDPSMRDSSLDEELSVGDQSIMEVVSGDIVIDTKETPALIVDAAPTPLPAPPSPAPPLPASTTPVAPAKVEAPELELSSKSEDEEEDEPAVVAPAPIAPAPVDPSSTPVPVALSSAAQDIGLAKTMLSSGPVAMPPMPAATGRVPEPSAEFDDPFPAIPPLDPTEKQRQAQQQGMDVPPLFEAAPPVPAPISPDATSGVAPVSVEKARRSRNIAIGVAVVLGLGGGIGGGLFAFDRLMKGEDSAGVRSVTLVADAGASAITEPVQTPPIVEDAAALAQSATEDAAIAVNAGDDRDASALVAQAEDGSTSTGVEDATSAVANNVVEDSGVPDPANSTNTASNTQPSAPEDSGVATQPVAPDGVTVVAGASGLSSPDWRIRAGARRLVKERVEGCGQGSVRGTARFEVRFDGATGRVIEFNLSGAHFRNTPVGACIESAMRSVALPPFTERHWDTDYAVPLR
ncbi:MAG: protein kinase [Polyangiales bacterium]